MTHIAGGEGSAVCDGNPSYLNGVSLVRHDPRYDIGVDESFVELREAYRIAARCFLHALVQLPALFLAPSGSTHQTE
jgi:hypothetical protein